MADSEHHIAALEEKRRGFKKEIRKLHSPRPLPGDRIKIVKLKKANLECKDEIASLQIVG